MKKILVFFSLIFVLFLFACNDTKDNNVDDNQEIAHKDISYAILTNEESVKNLDYKASDFNLESLSSVVDCNELNNINNVNLSSYKKILKFSFNKITNTEYDNNVNLIKDDKRIEKYITSNNIEFKKFNYDSLEKNIEFSKIQYEYKISATGQLKSEIINSSEKRNEYISYLTNLGNANSPIVSKINEYGDEYFNNKSLVFVEFELPNPNSYIDFIQMNLNDNKLQLEFNRYQAPTASIQVIIYSYLIIEIPNSLTDVKLEYNVKTR